MWSRRGPADEPVLLRVTPRCRSERFAAAPSHGVQCRAGADAETRTQIHWHPSHRAVTRDLDRGAGDHSGVGQPPRAAPAAGPPAGRARGGLLLARFKASLARLPRRSDS